MADSQVSVGGSLVYAWRLWRGGWRAIWGALALSSLAATVAGAGALAGKLEIWAVGVGAGVVTQIIVQGAVFRLALADRHPGAPEFVPGSLGIQWRPMEWRLLAAGVLKSLLLLLFVVLCAIPVAGVAIGVLMAKGVTPRPDMQPDALAAMLGSDGSAAVLIVFLIAEAICVMLWMRLNLVEAATADSGRIRVLQSWPLTRGHVAAMFLTTILISLPYILLATVVQQAVAEVTTPGITPPTHYGAGPAIIAGGLGGVLAGGVYEPLLLAAMAYYYRNLKTPDAK